MSNQNTTEGDCPPTNYSAFPFVVGDSQQGMTLRDYFAAKAMAAMLTHDAHKNDWTDANVAEWSYNAADAMMDFRQNAEVNHSPDKS